MSNGAPVAAGDKIIALDTLDLNLQMKKLSSRVALAKLAESRMSDEYLKRFVLGPMQEEIDTRTKVLALVIENANLVANRVKSGGTNLTENDALQAWREADASRLKVAEARSALAEKQIQIERDKARKVAEEEQLEETREVIQRQIDMQYIIAPRAGTVTIAVADGLFVNKGDSLFSVR